MLLEGNGIVKRFGALTVLDRVDLTVGANEALGIVGPNGAGKTTLMDVFGGALTPNSGTVRLLGEDVTTTVPDYRSRRGLGRTHQIPRPFSRMTVFENVLVAATHGGRSGGHDAGVVAFEALEICGMLHVANRRAEQVGLLDRKRLELARALATGPKVLLLDEIGGGLTDAEAAELVRTIKTLIANGLSIVWIEHIVHVLLQVTTRLICMADGRIIADGEPHQVMADPAIVEAYLGRTPE